MSIKYVFVDFDETLFNHHSYVQWLGDFMQKKYNINPDSFLQSFDDYHDVQDDKGLLRLYRHRDHLFEKTGLRWSSFSAEIEEHMQRENKHFCYDDAHEFLNNVTDLEIDSVRLLTYGDESYQRYKIGLCDKTSKLPVHITTMPKHKFLSNYFGKVLASGVLIDDKAPLTLPDNWQHIWLNRTNKVKPINDNSIEIQTLKSTDIISKYFYELVQ